LLDSLTAKPIDYASTAAKLNLLEKYFGAVNYGVSGRKITLTTDKLTKDLRKKADWLTRHIRKTEWLKEGFFNGYYNNDKERLEGRRGKIRMTLTSQVFPIMSGVATVKQARAAFSSTVKFLRDRALGGWRLNTDFKTEQLNMGRAFSFIYGDKENGAFFNHMAMMFGYALYKRGFVKEGFGVLDSIYRMAVNSAKSKIYPCLPEYFNNEGRGMYSYLTGSASWFILTVLTQAFGVRGEYGDLVIEPKLTAAQFKESGVISIKTVFLKRSLQIRFLNPCQKEFGQYRISQARINDRPIRQGIAEGRLLIPRRKILALTRTSQNNIIEVTLD
jgi:cellobiose phosphorylase